MAYEELVCGKVAGRPELDHCLKALRAGDTLVVRRLDRLGRNLTLGSEKPMAIEVRMNSLVTHQTFDGV